MLWLRTCSACMFWLRAYSVWMFFTANAVTRLSACHTGHEHELIVWLSASSSISSLSLPPFLPLSLPPSSRLPSCSAMAVHLQGRVVSGHLDALQLVTDAALKGGALKATMLAVSGEVG